ncbi:MAG: response regulator [Defluviitaleaceae bacterium]|nr:response regulator [Defluviitaleaceae bacterium]
MAENRQTIVLVDDDLTNLSAGVEALGSHYDVVTCNSGAVLIKMLERLNPDLILLDVQMPIMSGYEVLMCLKADPNTRDVPVIFLTAKASGPNELEGLSLGAIDYITKPFVPQLLLKRIEVHLESLGQKRALARFNSDLQQIVKEKTDEVLAMQFAMLKTMAVLVDTRDRFTGSHIDRTQSYLRVLLETMAESGNYQTEMADWDIELILHSSVLHDVGKVGVSDTILNKPGKLTDEEFTIIKKHTILGEQAIENIQATVGHSSFLEYARIMAISHHEKYNGMGYPHGLKGEDIPLLGRLLAIADVYDALVSVRPYKSPMAHEKAVEIITKDSGTHFDPKLVEIFVKCNKEFEKLTNEFNS